MHVEYRNVLEQKLLHVTFQRAIWTCLPLSEKGKFAVSNNVGNVQQVALNHDLPWRDLHVLIAQTYWECSNQKEPPDLIRQEKRSGFRGPFMRKNTLDSSKGFRLPMALSDFYSNQDGYHLQGLLLHM